MRYYRNIHTMLALTFTISSLFTMCFSMLIRSQRGIICTTECNEGQMCNDDECEPCPNGYYMNEPGHRQIYCYKWTEKPTYNAIILKNGTAKTDVVWVCADGYMKKEFAAGGSWECIKITTTTIATTTTTETPVSSSSTSSPSDTTFKTDNPYKSQESKKNNVAAIVISVLVVCIIVIFVVIYCWRKTIIKKKKETNNDPELGQLYNKIMEVIGIEKCSQLLLHLTNPINANIISTVECIEFFRKWERNCREHNPDFNHSEDIVRALETLGYILPGTNLTDPAVVIESLNKAEKLNNEFRKFCLVLCTELGADAEVLILRLNLKHDFELKLHNSSIKFAFADCLALWSWSKCYDTTTTNWLPLTIIENKLDELEKTHILENWSVLTKTVKQVYKKLILVQAEQKNIHP